MVPASPLVLPNRLSTDGNQKPSAETGGAGKSGARNEASRQKSGGALVCGFAGKKSRSGRAKGGMQHAQFLRQAR